MNSQMKNKNFKIEEEKWQKFKKLARESGSNASVELRRFIQEYIKENEHNDLQYKIESTNDLRIGEMKNEVYNIEKSIYNWFKNRNNEFRRLLDPDYLFSIIDIENIKKLPKKYWVDIVRAVLILKGFGCDDVFVFGSTARGIVNSDSDLDLAVSGCPQGVYYEILGKLINILEHEVDLIYLDKDDDKFVRQIKEKKEGELKRVTKRGD